MSENKQNGIDIEVIGIELDKLQHFANHPFKLYEGQTLDDMVESVRNNGVLHPIIVRPILDSTGNESGMYEILSGHNRFEASKVANHKEIPAVIRRGLSDDDAMLIVTETNLIQRSFKDMSHSERAIAISKHYNAMKKTKGYRTDLIKEIEEMMKPADNDKTSAPVGLRLETREKIGSQYDISKNTVARYLRIDKLVDGLKERLDDDRLSIRSAVSLSYLSDSEQKILAGLLGDDTVVSMDMADVLRVKSEEVKGKLKKSDIEKILKVDSTNTATVKPKPYKLNRDLVTKYFSDSKNPEDIDKILSDALEQYFASQNK